MNAGGMHIKRRNPHLFSFSWLMVGTEPVAGTIAHHFYPVVDPAGMSDRRSAVFPVAAIPSECETQIATRHYHYEVFVQDTDMNMTYNPVNSAI